MTDVQQPQDESLEDQNPRIDLREYVDRRIDDLKELLETQFDLRDRALTIAREEVNRRLEGMNELRNQIQSERGTFVSREMLDQRLAALEARMRQVEFTRSPSDSK